MNKNPNTHKNLKYVKVTKKNIKQNSPFYISTNNIKNSNNYKTSAEYQIKNFNTIENGPNNIKQISQIQLPTKKSNLKGNSLSLLKNKLSSNQSLNSLNPKKSFNCCNIINNYYVTDTKKNECLTVRQQSLNNKYSREKKIIKNFRKQYDHTSDNIIQASFKTNRDSINNKLKNHKLSNYNKNITKDLINNTLISNCMINTPKDKNMKIFQNKTNFTKKINQKKSKKSLTNKTNFISNSNKYLIKENIFNNTEVLIPSISRREISNFKTLNNKISIENNEAKNISFKKIIPNKPKNIRNYIKSYYPLVKANSSTYLPNENRYKNLKLYSNIIPDIPINLNLNIRKTESPDLQNSNFDNIPNTNLKFKRSKKVFDNTNLLLDDNLYIINSNTKNNNIAGRQSITNFGNYSTTLIKSGNLLINKPKTIYNNYNINTERKIENNNKKLPIPFAKNLSPILNLKKKDYYNHKNKEKLNKILICSDKSNSKIHKYNNKQFDTCNNQYNAKCSLNKVNINNITNCIKELAILCVNQEKIINDLSEDNRELSKRLCQQNLKK